MESQVLLKKYKNKVLNAAVIFMTLIIISNIYKGQSQEVKNLSLTRESEMKKNDVLASLNSSEKKISAFKKAFSRKDPSLIINNLSNVARESNVKIISINPRGQDNRTAYIRYPFDLVVGVENYHSLGRFVSSIENSGDMFFIEKLGIKPTEKSVAQEQKYGLIVSLTVSSISYR